MDNSVNRDVKAIIERTSDAFAQYDSVNADYASFASMALSEFKTALNEPDLTGRELRRMLRRGHVKHQAQDSKASWSTFMAQYVERKANSNKQDDQAR